MIERLILREIGQAAADADPLAAIDPKVLTGPMVNANIQSL